MSPSTLTKVIIRRSLLFSSWVTWHRHAWLQLLLLLSQQMLLHQRLPLYPHPSCHRMLHPHFFLKHLLLPRLSRLPSLLLLLFLLHPILRLTHLMQQPKLFWHWMLHRNQRLHQFLRWQELLHLMSRTNFSLFLLRLVNSRSICLISSENS